MREAGMNPDPWQERLLLSSSKRVLLCCSRQAGKTRAAAALVLNEALLRPRSTCLCLSPSERQSGEFFAVVREFYDALGRPVDARKESALQLSLVNGSRIIALPENERGVRCYSGVRLLAIDEASRVSEDLYGAVRPMLAVSGGRLLALSTPFGMRGWFYEEWSKGKAWERYRVKAEQCPRITPEFLADERDKGERYYQQEFNCSFEAATDAVFDPLVVRAAVKPGSVLFG